MAIRSTTPRFSLLHQPTGLSITLAAGYSDKESVDGHYGYAKVSYQTDIFEAGKTAFSVDAYFGRDIKGKGTDSDSYGVQVVQNLDYWQTELFVGARTIRTTTKSQVSKTAMLCSQAPD